MEHENAVILFCLDVKTVSRTVRFILSSIRFTGIYKHLASFHRRWLLRENHSNAPASAQGELMHSSQLMEISSNVLFLQTCSLFNFPIHLFIEMFNLYLDFKFAAMYNTLPLSTKLFRMAKLMEMAQIPN